MRVAHRRAVDALAHRRLGVRYGGAVWGDVGRGVRKLIRVGREIQRLVVLHDAVLRGKGTLHEVAL